MTHILVTGATGTLGKQVVKALAERPNVDVRLMSRRPLDFENPGMPNDHFQGNTTSPSARASWVQADLKSGEGLSEAVRNIDVIIHCATSLRKLLEATRTMQVAHIVYISIVGCDRIPFGYYRQKVAEEEAIKTSGIPWTTLRATQFHALIDFFLRTCSKLPWITPLPTDWQLQSIAECEVGRRMVDLALTPPTGTIEQIGGPQVLFAGDMAHRWMTLRQEHRLLLPLWLPGQMAAGFRQGHNTCGIELPHGKITWEQWLHETYQEPMHAPVPHPKTVDA